MKAFDKLSIDECAVLGPTAVDRYVELLCADRGVAFNPIPPSPVSVTEPEPDVEVWRVGRLTFADEADAKKLLAFASSLESRLDYTLFGGSYENKMVCSPHSLVVEKARMFSEDAATLHEPMISAFREDTRRHDLERLGYDKALKARAEVRSEIERQIAKAQHTLSQRAHITKEYQRYLELADGDVRIARRFLEASFPEAPTVAPKLFDALTRELEASFP